jgi:hypothetical protein
MVSPFTTGPLAPVVILNLIRTLMGITNLDSIFPANALGARPPHCADLRGRVLVAVRSSRQIVETRLPHVGPRSSADRWDSTAGRSLCSMLQSGYDRVAIFTTIHIGDVLIDGVFGGLIDCLLDIRHLCR